MIFVDALCFVHFFMKKVGSDPPGATSYYILLKEMHSKIGLKVMYDKYLENGINDLEFLGRKILQDSGLKLNEDFHEQVIILDKYLVDILLPTKNIIIEWDGNHWHSLPKSIIRDKLRDEDLNKNNYKIIRFTETQIKERREDIIEDIVNICKGD